MARAGREAKDLQRMEAFGARLRAVRQERGLSQEQLAHTADINRAVVGFIERGEREPGLTLVCRLADGLGVSPSQLLSGLS